MKFATLFGLVSANVFIAAGAPSPITALIGSPLTDKTSIASRDNAVRLTFLDADNAGYWVDIPLDTGYISPINLDGLTVSYILPWANFNSVYCVFWNAYPTITQGSLPVSYDNQDVTHFDPATEITYIQCCNGKCPDWALWGGK